MVSSENEHGNYEHAECKSYNCSNVFSHNHTCIVRYGDVPLKRACRVIEAIAISETVSMLAVKLERVEMTGQYPAAQPL